MEKHRPAGDPIYAVTGDPAPERFARMRANLVPASRDGTKLDQCGPIADSQAAPVRCCGKTMLISDHPPARFRAGFLAEWNVDDTALLRELGCNDGHIIFLDLARLERF